MMAQEGGDRSLSALPGVGPARLAALEKAGLTTLCQLLLRFPKDYLDFSQRTLISDLRPGDRALFAAKIKSVRTFRAHSMLVVRAVAGDDGGDIPLVWFNQPYVARTLEVGAQHLFYGMVYRVRGVKQVQSPQRYPLTSQGVLPIYPSIPGVPQKSYVGWVRAAWDLAGGEAVQELLPAALRSQFGLPEAGQALRAVHFPNDAGELAAALRRFSFVDLLLYQLAMQGRRLHAAQSLTLPVEEARLQSFLSQLPYPLTAAQRRVLGEILNDMRQETPMARLVEGDVGCGKTILAFAALYVAALNGCQGALMAPTEVLVQQHFQQAVELFTPFGVTVARLTGSVKGAQRRETLRMIESGEALIVIGTHALAMEGVRYAGLGLIVTDEQHRFGVHQRTALEKKGNAPHVLVMSATPIPRTLSLVLYGDLDLSVVDELPPGRRKVETRIVPEAKRPGLYRFMLDAISNGRQAYVVCPLVEESEAMDAASAQEIHLELQQKLPGARVELLHGRMAGNRKDQLLLQFAQGQIDVLVSTTVIEVGVNVPNATIMVIENAERFGLAQLHQLRGRVGRGAEQSWCFLMAEPIDRLRFLTQTSDGFAIAQKDLELRGPGEFLGTRQHGLADGRLLALCGDAPLLSQVKQAAQAILDASDTVENAQLLQAAQLAMVQKGFFYARN